MHILIVVSTLSDENKSILKDCNIYNCQLLQCSLYTKVFYRIKMLTMKAVRWSSSESKLQLAHVDIPEVEPSEVLVKVARAGICGTDLHILDKKYRSAEIVTLGHENCGTVIKIGRNVTSISVGTRVAVNPNIPCENCDMCLTGRPNVCGLNIAIGVFCDGGWAEYMVVPEKQVFTIPDDLSFKAACFSEPLGCILNALRLLGNICAGDRVLIIGAAAAGILIACTLHHRGCRDITISVPSESRKKIARETNLGFNVVDPKDLALMFKGKNIDTEGFKVVIDASGSADAINEAFKLMARSGTMCLYGLPSPDSIIQVCPSDIVLKELKISGAFINCFTFPEAVALAKDMSATYLNYKLLGIKEYVLEDHQQAISDLRNKHINKAVFCIDDASD